MSLCADRFMFVAYNLQRSRVIEFHFSLKQPIVAEVTVQNVLLHQGINWSRGHDFVC
jgi:hypothetical protein